MNDEQLENIDNVFDKLQPVVDKALLKAWWIGFIAGAVSATILSLLIQFIFSSANAHTPCDYVEDEPYCHYVQVVNPVTGVLEQHYVCD